MTAEEIKNTLCGLLKRIAPDSSPEKLQDEDDIRHVLGIDSFDALQFIVAIHDHYQVEIPEEDYGKITTLKNLVAYLQQKMKK